MKFKSAEEMLSYVQEEYDIWSPDVDKYIYLFNLFGSICVYNIDLEKAKELQELSIATGDEYWGAYLGTGGTIYDTLEWYNDKVFNGEEFSPEEMYDHALEYCEEYYKYEWIDCREVMNYGE